MMLPPHKLCPRSLAEKHRERLLPKEFGFTLLEICLALFIMTLALGLCMYSFGGLQAEDELRKPANELKRMTLEAMRLAYLSESAQTITFDSRGFQLINSSVTGEKLDLFRNKLDTTSKILVPDGMQISLKRWGTNKFTKASGQHWIFLPGGLCEPIKVRFENHKSWLEMTFDPLSGAVIEEDMEVVGGP